MYTYHDDLGQLLLLKVNELRWDSSLERCLRRLRPGGVVIDSPLTAGAETVCEVLSKVACAVPPVPFLALEEEGGASDPLQGFLPPLPSPRAAAEKGLAAVRRLGELVGAAFELAGFNTNLAPVLDLASPAAGTRSYEPRKGTPCPAPTWETGKTHAFSSDPQQVAKCGAAFLGGLERHGVRACGKHFPGLGSTVPEAAAELPLVDKSMAALWREDLVPYRALLPRLPLVLISPAAYKAYDFDLPQSAGLSPKVIEGLLRLKLGYDGVAIVYGLESETVRGTLQFEEAAVRTLRAGCDMLLLEKAEEAQRALGALNAARDSGQLPSHRVEQALNRIQHAKQGLKPPTGAISKIDWRRIVLDFEDFSSQFASGIIQQT
jgi:beta-N-acetylhexosaminidase